MGCAVSPPYPADVVRRRARTLARHRTGPVAARRGELEAHKHSAPGSHGAADASARRQSDREGFPGGCAPCSGLVAANGAALAVLKAGSRLERDGFSSNRHHAPAYCWSMMFFRKPVSTFRHHALANLLNLVWL